jgi:hypothetical protein
MYYTYVQISEKDLFFRNISIFILADQETNFNKKKLYA